MRSGDDAGLLAVEQLADLDSAVDDVLARRLDVGDDELEALG